MYSQKGNKRVKFKFEPKNEQLMTDPKLQFVLKKLFFNIQTEIHG